MNIIFDLDGTLIDSKFRLYKLFQDLVPESSLSFGDYWEIKKEKISNEHILKNLYSYGDEKTNNFLNSWMSLIEAPKYLELDKNFPGTQYFIKNNLCRFNLYICTDRQFVNSTIFQLKYLGLFEYFKKVLVTEQKRKKEDLIIDEVPDLSSEDWIVGDTGKDIEAGHALRIKTCAVTSGFLSLESLLPYRPTCIINSVIEFTIPTENI